MSKKNSGTILDDAILAVELDRLIDKVKQGTLDNPIAGPTDDILEVLTKGIDFILSFVDGDYARKVILEIVPELCYAFYAKGALRQMEGSYPWKRTNRPDSAIQ